MILQNQASGFLYLFIPNTLFLANSLNRCGTLPPFLTFFHISQGKGLLGPPVSIIFIICKYTV